MKVVKYLYHPLFFILTVLLGIAIGYRIYEWRHFGQSEPIMLITAVVIMVISMFKDRLFDTLTLKNLEEMKRTSNEGWEALTGWVKTHLSPTILSLDDNNAVLSEASDIINATIKEPSQSNKFIVYVGSGDLLKDPPETDEGNSPLTEYQSALARLKNDGIAISRYISLLDKSDYRRRIAPTRAAYKRWLLKQIALLDSNPQYTFYDTPRAPKWGSSRSSIFSHRALLDVIGNGQSGVLVRGDRVAQELLKGSKDLFENAGNKPSVYQAARLQAYLDSLDDPRERRRRTNKGKGGLQ